jgi:hypothetical protein
MRTSCYNIRTINNIITIVYICFSSIHTTVSIIDTYLNNTNPIAPTD